MAAERSLAPTPTTEVGRKVRRSVEQVHEALAPRRSRRVVLNAAVADLVAEHGAREVLRALIRVAGDEVQDALPSVAADTATAPPTPVVEQPPAGVPFDIVCAVIQGASEYAKTLKREVDASELRGLIVEFVADAQRTLTVVH